MIVNWESESYLGENQTHLWLLNNIHSRPVLMANCVRIWGKNASMSGTIRTWPYSKGLTLMITTVRLWKICHRMKHCFSMIASSLSASVKELPSKNYPTLAVSPLHTESVSSFSSSNKTSSGLILVKLNCLESNFCLTIVISCGFLLSVALLTFNCNQVVRLFLIQVSIKHIISIYYFTDWSEFYLKVI